MQPRPTPETLGPSAPSRRWGSWLTREPYADGRANER